MARPKRGPAARSRVRARRPGEKVRRDGGRHAKDAKQRAAKVSPRTDYPVAEVVARLHHHRQRATYEAVAGLRKALAVRVRGWFARREAPENSFVVSRLTGEPTHYPPASVHPALKARASVIETTEALRAWLEEHPLPPA